MLTINCRCEAVELALDGGPVAQFYCHCDDCQIVHGAAYVPAAMWPREKLRIVRGAPSSWALRATPRTTCRECGTRLFASPPGAPVHGVTATLLPPGSFRPAFHMFCRYAVLPVKDDLPHYAGVPALFGGSDTCVDW